MVCVLLVLCAVCDVQVRHHDLGGSRRLVRWWSLYNNQHLELGRSGGSKATGAFIVLVLMLVLTL